VLRAKGIAVETRLNVGSRETLLPAMKRGDVDVLPEYTGGLLTFLSEGEGATNDTAGHVAALRRVLPSGPTVLEPSAAQDQNTMTARARSSTATTCAASRTSPRSGGP
jgi:osmoprotectant transport system substrate-binding protein